MSNEKIDVIRETNAEAKQIILGSLEELANEIRNNHTWNIDEINNFLIKYDIILKNINSFLGASKAHQENNGLVYFDFDPKDLLVINSFLKEDIIPAYKKLENPKLHDEEKRKSFERFLHYLNGMVIESSIYIKGSYKQNA